MEKRMENGGKERGTDYGDTGTVEYEVNEVLPLVAELAATYTGTDHTSITYEKAEQLMEAVLYCIHEYGFAGAGEVYIRGEEPAGRAVCGKVSARQAYDAGLALVQEKAKRALGLYHRILPRFNSYGNRCLHDTVIKGMPAFFRWYDRTFDPQNTILTLDYPVLTDLSGFCGVDRIYEYLICIRNEQMFLGKMAEEYVVRQLRNYDRHYEEMVENICEVLLVGIAGHILVKKPLEQSLIPRDYGGLEEILLQKDGRKLKEPLSAAVKSLMENDGRAGVETAAYLNGVLDSVVLRLQTAAEHGVLERMLG